MEVIGKTKEETVEKIKVLDVQSTFNNAVKIRDISNMHYIQFAEWKYKTRKYAGMKTYFKDLKECWINEYRIEECRANLSLICIF